MSNQGIPQINGPPPLLGSASWGSLGSTVQGSPPPSPTVTNDIYFANHPTTSQTSSQSFVSNDDPQQNPNMVELLAFENAYPDENSVIDEHSADTQHSTVENGEEVTSHFTIQSGYYVYNGNP